LVLITYQGAEALFMKNQQVKHYTIAPEKKMTSLINKHAKNISRMKQQKQMFEETYSINQNLMYMAGFYDCQAKACTLVRETERIFVVHQSPLEILEYSIKKVGYNLKGAMETSREANGSKMCPIMVNLLQKLVVFPTHSAKHVETMWLNPDQIQRTYRSKRIKRKTNIEFKNGLIISVDSRLTFFNDKLKRAEQYRDTTIAAAQHSLSFLTNRKNGKFLLGLLVALKCLTEIAEVLS
jgi:competence protein ComK